MKKTISVLLSVCLVLTTLMAGFVTVYAESNQIGSSSVYWNYNAETKTLYFEGEGAIPDYAYPTTDDENNPVLEYPWKDADYETIVFGSGITGIGNYAFAYSSSLKEVVIPDTVTVLSTGIFLNCENLESAVLPLEVTELSTSIFSNCGKLKNVTLSAKTEKIGKDAFYHCSSLESITFPETLKEIGEAAFHSSGLKGVALPEGFETLGEHAFYCCEDVESISLPSTLTSIGKWAFEGCRNLTEITFPDSITSLPENVCTSCQSLESVTLPETLTSIGANAFYGCPELKAITIPAATTVIGDKALGYGKWGAKVKNFTITGCANSEPVINYAKAHDFTFVPEGFITSGTCGDNITWKFDTDKKSLLLEGTGPMPDFAADSFVAFNLLPCEQVTVLSGITKIGSYAFYNNTATNYIIAPEVSEIGEKAIGYYDNEGTPTLRDGVKIQSFAGSEIMRYALENGIEFSAIGYVTSGTCGENVTWEFNYEEKTLYINGSGAMDDYTAESFVPYQHTPYEKVVIAPEITKIGSYAFYNAAAMEFVLLENVTEIGEKAIGYYDNEGTPALREGTSISGYDGLVPMTYAADNGITFLSLGEYIVTEGKLGDNVTWTYDKDTKVLTVSGTGATYDYTFENLPEFAKYDIESITVSDGITVIGDYAFCTFNAYSSITLGKDITEIGENAFGFIKAVKLDGEGNPTEEYETAIVDTTIVYGYIVTPADEYSIKKGLKFEALDGDVLPLFSLIVPSVIDHIKNLIIIYKNNPDAAAIREAFSTDKFIEVIFPDVFGTGKEITLVNENGTYTYKLVVKGDNNGDGTINSSDALAVLQHSVQSNVMEDDCLINASDLNHDGQVNSSDALAILQISVGNREDDTGYNPGIIR